MKLSIDTSDLEVVPSRTTSIKSKKIIPKNNETNILGVIKYIGNEYKVQVKDKLYNISYPLDYKPLIIFSTYNNDAWEYAKPHKLSNPKLIKDLTEFWSPVFSHMTVCIDSITDELIANIDIHYLEVKAKAKLKSYNTKHSVKPKKDADTECD